MQLRGLKFEVSKFREYFDRQRRVSKQASSRRQLADDLVLAAKQTGRSQTRIGQTQAELGTLF